MYKPSRKNTHDARGDDRRDLLNDNKAGSSVHPHAHISTKLPLCEISAAHSERATPYARSTRVRARTRSAVAHATGRPGKHTLSSHLPSNVGPPLVQPNAHGFCRYCGTSQLAPPYCVQSQCFERTYVCVLTESLSCLPARRIGLLEPGSCPARMADIAAEARCSINVSTIHFARHFNPWVLLASYPWIHLGRSSFLES